MSLGGYLFLKLYTRKHGVLNVPKVTFYRVVGNLYSVELNVRLIKQILGPRNIDVLPVFFKGLF